MADRPLMISIAGPNGAGKSTFYRMHLADVRLPFINADEIAEHDGCDAYTAAARAENKRLMFVAMRTSFVFETVLSDPEGEKVSFIKLAQDKGYDTILVFIGISSPDQSEQRVCMRVSKGGHDVPTEKILSRYPRTMDNLVRAIRTLPDVRVYDNSLNGQAHRLIAMFKDGIAVRLSDSIPPWFVEILDRLGKSET